MIRLLELFWCFFQIGLCSIGGGYATISMIQQQVVLEKGWLTTQSFLDMITISQMTPGPLAINTSTFAGMQTAGFAGAIMATLGCISAGCIIAVSCYHIVSLHKNNPYIIQIIAALKAVSTGLIACSCVTILNISLFSDEGFSIEYLFILVGAIILLRRYHLHPMILMMLSGCIGSMLYFIL